MAGSTIYQQNLKLLSENNPELVRLLPAEEPVGLEYAEARNGSPVMSWQGRQLHSAYDPEGEAFKRIKALHIRRQNRLVVLGADLLYSAQRILADHPDMISYFVYQDRTILLTLLVSRDLSFLQGRKAYFYIKDLAEWDFSNIYTARLSGTLFLVNQALYEIDKEYFESIKRSYLEAVSGWYTAGLTRFYFEKKKTVNCLQNLAAVPGSISLPSLKGSGGGSCLVVCAGPSLHQLMERIIAAADSTVIIACDTALHPLILRGIRPDYIVSLDPGFYNYLDFDLVPAEGSILLADIAVYPGIPRLFPGRTCFFRSRPGEEQENFSSVTDKMLDTFGLSNKVGAAFPSGGSISHTALELAEYLGFSEIYFAGLDMSSPFFHSHAFSTTHFNYYYDRSNRYYPLSSQDFSLVTGSTRELVGNTEGESIYTELMLEQYAEYFERRFKIASPATCYNLSRIGRPLAGMPAAENIDGSGQSPGKGGIIDTGEGLKQAYDTQLSEFEDLLDFIHSYLKKVELKELDGLDAVENEISERLNRLAWLKDGLDFVSLSILRREYESPWLQSYALYLEIYKYLNVLKKYLLLGRKRSA